MVNIIIHGACGHMGRAIATLANTMPQTYKIIAGIDRMMGSCDDVASFGFPVYSDFSACEEPCDVIIDFSTSEAIPNLLSEAKRRNCAIVVATTGLSAEYRDLVEEYSKYIPIFRSANMSLGVNLQTSLVRQTAHVLGDAFDIEIIEKHHNKKIDAPSGTALSLAEAIQDEFANQKHFVYDRSTKRERREKSEIGIHAVRGGTVVGEHQVLFFGEDEILEITHKAASRNVFAVGALKASAFIKNCTPGLYNMSQMLAEETSVTKIMAAKGQCIITITSLDHVKGEMCDVFDKMSGINIDMISQTMPYSNNLVDISFSLSINDLDTALSKLNSYENISHKKDLARLTIEGLGMEHKSGVAAGVFRAINSARIPLFLVTTSETKISMCIPEDRIDNAISTAKIEFEL